MEIILNCSECGSQNLVDTNNLSIWPIDNILKVAGYFCENCQQREPVYYTTDALEESLRGLNKIKSSNRNFAVRFGKTLKKFEAVQERGEKHGAFQYDNQAPPG